VKSSSKSVKEMDDIVTSARELGTLGGDKLDETTFARHLGGILGFGLKYFVIFPRDCQKTAWCLFASATDHNQSLANLYPCFFTPAVTFL
jgi:hypothetical protein